MKMIFKLCLVTMLTVFRSADAASISEAQEQRICDRDVFVDEIKRNSPWPETRPGKCLVDCMLETNDMLGDDGLIDVEKFTKSVNESRMSDDEPQKWKNVADNCKNHKHLSEDRCENAALFLECASEESVKIGFESTDLAKMIRAIYIGEIIAGSMQRLK